MMGTGIDVTSIERIQRLTEETAFSDRVFTKGELACCELKKNPARHLAGHFSAKEAFMKALGTGWTGGVSWRDIEVTKQEGRLTLVLSGRTAELTGDRAVHLSIAHSKKLAIATVIIE